MLHHHANQTRSRSGYIRPGFQPDSLNGGGYIRPGISTRHAVVVDILAIRPCNPTSSMGVGISAIRPSNPTHSMGMGILAIRPCNQTSSMGVGILAIRPSNPTRSMGMGILGPALQPDTLNGGWYIRPGI